jgi:hypothetical protein
MYAALKLYLEKDHEKDIARLLQTYTGDASVEDSTTGRTPVAFSRIRPLPSLVFIDTKLSFLPLLFGYFYPPNWIRLVTFIYSHFLRFSPSRISAAFTLIAPDSTGFRFVMQTRPATLSLLCSFCSSDQDFAAGFLQIPPHGGHPCL